MKKFHYLLYHWVYLHYAVIKYNGIIYYSLQYKRYFFFFFKVENYNLGDPVLIFDEKVPLEFAD